MRIRALWLDGYGCFVNRVLELPRNFQLLFGPNEQGKSTVRCFIGDMLYGQKRSSRQRLYEESNELRRPWSPGARYAGRMVYRLDNEHEIEVRRVFDRNEESVRVYDRTLAREITEEFPRLPNRESAFAEQHLGVSKEVFLSTATISHLNLEHLGDEDAMGAIREKILSLADTGEESGTSESALTRLEEWIAAIGRPTARSRPLPLARIRLSELDEELAAARAARKEAEALEARRQELREALRTLAEQRRALEAEQVALERAERAERLCQAVQVEDEIRRATQRCFELSSLHDFPLEQEAELQRLINVTETARTQLRRTQTERSELEEQLAAERRRLAPYAAQPLESVREEDEQRLADLESRIARLAEYQERLEGERHAVQKRVSDAKENLERLPDFSRFSANPVEWLSQLATSFRLQCESRNRERRQLEQTRSLVAQLENNLAKPMEIFQFFADFPAEARDYKVAVRWFEEKSRELSQKADELRIAAEGCSGAMPRQRNLAAICGVATAGFVLTAYLSENWGVCIPAGLFGLGTAYFFIAFAWNRLWAKKARHRLAGVQLQLDALQGEVARKRRRIDHALAAVKHESLRELEALYDRCVKDQHDLTARRTELAAREQKVRQEDQRTRQLVTELRDIFQRLGIDLSEEEGVQEAANAAIARYQEHRDAKRRMGESQRLLDQLQVQFDKILREREAAQAEERSLAIRVRQHMSKQGFGEERHFTSALRAVRAYRNRCSEVREKRARIEVLEEHLAEVRAQVAAEERDLQEQEARLERFVRAAGAESIEQWREQAEQAREYRKAREQRAALEDKLETLLRGDTLEGLRAQVEAEPAQSVPPERSAQAIRGDLDRLAEAVAAHTREEHALDIKIAERSALGRSVSEIEEEQATVAWRAERLSFELEAAALAAAVIEEVAQDRHARIAPRLAAAASQYLARITGNAYDELLLSRDLRITVRIPQTHELHEEPERCLSKGTVDQIYLVLRLALVEGLGRNGESVPLLLDDPFGNYDDGRLARTLDLLARIAQARQVLLFTCHQNIAQAGQAAGASVLEL